MMSSAAVALKAPLTPEPVLDALRALTQRAPSSQTPNAPAQPDATERAATVAPVAQDAVATSPEMVIAAHQQPVTWVEPPNLWLLSLKNFGLTLATFGVYHFWGRAEMTRQTLNSIHVDDKPLDYSGTGKEGFVSFFLGAVIAISIVSAFVYLFIVGARPGGSATVEGIRNFRWQRLIISLPLLFLLGSITYRKRHHILQRTWFNGERFGLTGHAWSYAWRHFWSALLVPLTLGWAAPWRSSMLEARKISETQHGTTRFHAEPKLKSLYRAFALVWFGGGLLYVATLVALSFVIGQELTAAINGLTLEPLKSWHIANSATRIIAIAALPMLTVVLLYRKAWLEHQISTVAFERGNFHLKLPTLRYLGIAYSGLALSIVSLGCFKPVADARFMKFVVDHVRVEGALRFDQGAVPKPQA